MPLVLTQPSEDRYVTVKVCTRDSKNSARVRRELKFYEHLISLGASRHIGQAFIRGLLGTFEMTGSGGRHLCLVHPPMHMTMRELQYKNPSHKLNETLLKWTMSNLLQALSFLHEEAKVVHSGTYYPLSPRKTIKYQLYETSTCPT